MATLEITIHSFRSQDDSEPESPSTTQDSLIERVERVLDEQAPARKPSEPTDDEKCAAMGAQARQRLSVCAEIRRQRAFVGQDDDRRPVLNEADTIETARRFPDNTFRNLRALINLSAN